MSEIIAKLVAYMNIALEKLKTMVATAVLQVVANKLASFAVALLASIWIFDPWAKGERGSGWGLSGQAICCILLTVLGGVALIVVAVRCKKNRHATSRRKRVRAAVTRQKGSALMPSDDIPSGGMLQNSIRDPRFLKGATGVVAAYGVAILLLFVFSDFTFGVGVEVRSKPGVRLGGAMVILLKSHQEAETVTTGILNADGVCTLRHRVSKGTYRVLVVTNSDGVVRWSECDHYIDSDRPVIACSGFPQYAHVGVAIPEMRFDRGSAVLLPSSLESSVVAQNMLLTHVGEVLLVGRTCDLQYPKGSSKSNYQLSLDRCRAVISSFPQLARYSHFVLAPFEDRQPVHPKSGEADERGLQRSVQLVPLLRKNSDNRGEPQSGLVK